MIFKQRFLNWFCRLTKHRFGMCSFCKLPSIEKIKILLPTIIVTCIAGEILNIANQILTKKKPKRKKK